jgi:hypothetical protein
MANKPVQIDYGMMGIWLRTSPELRAHLENLGKSGTGYAKSIAPVGSAPKDKHPGAYRDSLNYEIHQGKSRMSLRIGARDQKAHWIEFGAKHMPKFSVLRQTLDYLRGQMG